MKLIHRTKTSHGQRMFLIIIIIIINYYYYCCCCFGIVYLENYGDALLLTEIQFSELFGPLLCAYLFYMTLFFPQHFNES